MSSSGAIRDAVFSIHASTSSTMMNPRPSMNGRRSAAMIGGRMAFMIATRAATSSAPQNPGTETPGSTAAAASTPAPETSHATASLTGSSRGRSGFHSGRAPYRGSAIIRARAAPRAREALPG